MKGFHKNFDVHLIHETKPQWVRRYKKEILDLGFHRILWPLNNPMRLFKVLY